MTAIMPGAVATNLVRSMPREQLFGIARMLGQNPDELEWSGRRPPAAGDAGPGGDDGEEHGYVTGGYRGATIYALSVPENIQVSEIMLRPLMPLPAMPGFSVPA